MSSKIYIFRRKCKDMMISSHHCNTNISERDSSIYLNINLLLKFSIEFEEKHPSYAHGLEINLINLYMSFALSLGKLNHIYIYIYIYIYFKCRSCRSQGH